MKKTVIKPNFGNHISPQDIDPSRHFIGFTFYKHDGKADFSGYFVLDTKNIVKRAVCLAGSDPWNNFISFDNHNFSVALKMLLDWEHCRVFCFENRKEFYQWVADNSQ